MEEEMRTCSVSLQRLTPEDLENWSVMNKPKPPFLTYYELICQLNRGMKFENIDFKPLLFCKVDKMSMSEIELKFTENHHVMLQNILYDRVFKSPELITTKIRKEIIDILYADATPTGTESGEEVSLVNVLKARQFRSKYGYNILVRNPNVSAAEENGEGKVNLVIEIPKKPKLNITTKEVSSEGNEKLAREKVKVLE